MRSVIERRYKGDSIYESYMENRGSMDLQYIGNAGLVLCGRIYDSDKTGKGIDRGAFGGKAIRWKGNCGNASDLYLSVIGGRSMVYWLYVEQLF